MALSLGCVVGIMDFQSHIGNSKFCSVHVNALWTWTVSWKEKGELVDDGAKALEAFLSSLFERDDQLFSPSASLSPDPDPERLPK
jgi:hypothetical protein